MTIHPDSWIGWLLYWIVSGAALAITAGIVPGFRLKSFKSALVASLVIGLANIFIRPVLILLTFPLTILTLGLFIFVVDAIVLRLSAAMLEDFEISNWFSAIIGAVILAIMSSVLHLLII